MVSSWQLKLISTGANPMMLLTQTRQAAFGSAPPCYDLDTGCSPMLRSLEEWLCVYREWWTVTHSRGLAKLQYMQGANIGEHRGTLTSGLGEDFFFTEKKKKEKRAPLQLKCSEESLEGSYAGWRGSNGLWRNLSEQSEARALDQAQREVLTRTRVGL